jgi:hypothetical protein
MKSLPIRHFQLTVFTLLLLVPTLLRAGFIDDLDRVINQRISGCNTGKRQFDSYICSEELGEQRTHISKAEQFQGDVQSVVNRMEEWVYIRQKIEQKRVMMIAAQVEYGQLRSELQGKAVEDGSALAQLKREFFVLAELKRSKQILEQQIEECEDAKGEKLLTCQAEKEGYAVKLSTVEAMEVALVSSSPLLSHQAFQGKRKWFGLTDSDGGLLLASSKMDDREIDRRFTKQLKIALDDTDKKLSKRVKRYDQLLSTTHQKKDGAFFCHQCSDGIVDYLDDSDLLFELNPPLELGDYRHPMHGAICRLSQKYYLTKARGILNGFLLDSALVITPMGIAGALKGAVTVLKVAPKGARAASIGLQIFGEGAVIGAEINRLQDELGQCERVELDLSVDGGSEAKQSKQRTGRLMRSLQQCRQRVKDRVIDTSIALVGGIGLAGAHMVRLARPMIKSIKPSAASKVKQELLNIMQRGGLNATDKKMTGVQFNQLYDDLLDFAKRHNIKVVESKPGKMGAVGVFPKGVDRLELIGFKRATDLGGEVGAASRHELAHMFHTLQMRATLLESHGATAIGKVVDGKTKQAMNNYLNLFESSSSRNYREFEHAVTAMANPVLDGKSMSKVVNTSAADYSRRMTSLLNATEQATIVGKVRFPHGRSLQDVYGKVISRATIATGGSLTELAGTRLTPAIFAVYYHNNTYGLRDKVNAMIEQDSDQSM